MALSLQQAVCRGIALLARQGKVALALLARQRRVAIAALPIVLVSGFLLPVVSWPRPQPQPVTPTEQLIPISGVDPAAVDQSAVAMASWDELLDAGSTHELGLAPLDGSPLQGSTVPGPVVLGSGTPVHAHDRPPDSGHVHPAADLDPAPLEPAVATAALPTEDFGLVGVTADEPIDPQARILVRVREQDQWSPWTPMVVSEHGPDPGSAESDGVRYGTEPLLTGEADGVQVRIDTPGGEAPQNAQVVLMDNPVVPADAVLPDPANPDPGAPVATVAAATVGAAMPVVISRAEWGADESLRGAAPTYAGTIKASFIHHTVTRNDYTPEEAAQQVRNLYAWFTKGLRYSDMAYNFIVDRFGRLYEGRAGGMDRAVIGGHTAGFNNETFAVSALGNFQRLNPPPEQVAAMNESIAALLAWKLALNHRDPNGQVDLVSESASGTSRYQPGQVARALVVGGHRDIGSTKCPGQFMETQIPAIRAAAASKMGVTIFNPTVAPAPAYGTPDPVTITATSTAPISWTMTVTSRCGNQVRTMTGTQEAGGPLAIAWDKRDDAGNPVPPGQYSVTVTGSSGNDAIYPWTGTAGIAAAPGAPADPCGPPESFTLAGSGYGHGVGMSQWGAFGMAKEGLDAATIVTHYYAGTTVAPVADDVEVRVNLQYQVGTVKVRSEPLDKGGGAIEVTVGSNVVIGGPQDVFTFTVSGTSVAVSRESGGQVTDLGAAPDVLVRWAGSRVPGSASGPAGIVNVINAGNSFASDGHRYRYGYLDIVPVTTAGGVKLNAVNVVRVHDEYLYGVAEVPSSWPKEAMKAQAIAARSYALSKVADAIRKSCSCHVDDGGSPAPDQTFAGFAKETGPQGDKWAAAVRETFASDTTGLAVLFNGAPIRAYYTSSSGGQTTAASSAWGGDIPYARSVDDHWSMHDQNPHRSWTVTVPQASAAAAFGVPAVQKLAVGDRYDSGAVKQLVATLPDGSTRSISGTAMRAAFGLKSTYVTQVDGQAGVPLPAGQAGQPGPSQAGQPPKAPAGEQAAAPAAVKVTLKVKPNRKPKAGDPLMFRGRVLPTTPGLKVERQMLVDGAWKVMATDTTGKKGRYRFKVRRAVPAGANYTYRIVVYSGEQVIGTSPERTVKIGRKKG